MLTDYLINLIRRGAGEAMTDLEFIEAEIGEWLASPQRREQIKGEEYYKGIQDIRHKKRKAIGKDGELIEVNNLPNNRILDNQYALHVDRKTNYMVGKPFLYSTMSDEYARALEGVFNKKFMRTIRRVTRYALNGGISWLCPYYDRNGEFRFKAFPAHECLPFWADSEHTILDMLVRMYPVEVYEGKDKKLIHKVEVYSEDGIAKYIYDGGSLEPDGQASYIYADGKPLNWNRIPVIPFKYNSAEKPLLRDCKALQDGINKMLSVYQDNMETDAWSTIIVLTNYDGENLGEFRQNLSQYGAVKVRSDGTGHGGVDTLEIEVNSENYKVILDLFKKKLIENARSFDAKDDRVGSNANQMNLQSMYSDIDLDANGMESEFQASFEELMFFIDAHLSHIGKGNFQNENVEIKFDRDMLMNQTDIINNIRNSVGIISNETLIEAHPYVTEVKKEMQRMEKQKQDELMDTDYYKLITPGGSNG